VVGPGRAYAREAVQEMPKSPEACVACGAYSGTNPSDSRQSFSESCALRHRRDARRSASVPAPHALPRVEPVR